MSNSQLVNDLEAFVAHRRARRLTRVREVNDATEPHQQVSIALNAMLEAYDTDVELAEILKRNLNT